MRPVDNNGIYKYPKSEREYGYHFAVNNTMSFHDSRYIYSLQAPAVGRQRSSLSYLTHLSLPHLPQQIGLLILVYKSDSSTALKT